MITNINTEDVTTLTIHLNELKTDLDKFMRQENSFQKVKQVYFEIKEMECHLRALEWNPAHLQDSFIPSKAQTFFDIL
ncbi:MAG: hypothetical protein H0X41_00385 [Chitinophagaceae bacterium]|nr:hypothetical protein [Chitinophagaceae bacterium]